MFGAIARRLQLTQTVSRLGFINIMRVARYRIGMKMGCYKMDPGVGDTPGGVFFGLSAKGADKTAPLAFSQTLFSWHDHTFEQAPNWHQSLFNSGIIGQSDVTWDKALAALPNGADVKEIWELSRFYWVPELALKIRNGDPNAADILNYWLAHWVAHNPAYKGVNWGCGQEAGLRLLHCAQAAMILDEVEAAPPALVNLIATCAARIAPTLHYALSQANNHGSAEAAGLFVAGSWLARLDADKRAAQWARRGRQWLENRAQVLILEDGSSNQYSTNYHRVVLDTYAFTEVWRRHIGEAAFSKQLNNKLLKATHWLYTMTDPVTGDAPNFGANDGSLLFAPTRPEYRDHRPSVQLAAAMFGNASAYDVPDKDAVNDGLTLYNMVPPKNPLPPLKSKTFPNGGYHILRKGKAAAFMRFPNYKYRPSQADALHVDLHLSGRPILMDGGTYSYSSQSPEALHRTSCHNTITFDNRDQMPKFGQFLYGNWLRTKDLDIVHMDVHDVVCAAGYRDTKGAEHQRSLSLSDDSLRVCDQVKGFKSNAILRWRLAPGSYELHDNTIKSDEFRLRVSANVVIDRVSLVDGWTSGYYLKKTKISVLEVEVSQDGTLVTEVFFGTQPLAFETWTTLE